MKRLLAMSLVLLGLIVPGTADADGASEPTSVAPTPTAAPAPARTSKAVDVLATGDSMVLYLADSLSDQLRPASEATVRTDAYSGTGISKPLLFNWLTYALTQVKRYHPTSTVVFLGANDGYPLASRPGRPTRCCSAAWRRQYAKRARRMMEAYSRQGHAFVYWVLLPHARPPQSPDRVASRRRRSSVAVNAAVRLAARTMGGSVRLVPLDEVFTPGARYSDTIAWQGRHVNVRASDGIHLSHDGASIAASLLVAQMRADGLAVGG